MAGVPPGYQESMSARVGVCHSKCGTLTQEYQWQRAFLHRICPAMSARVRPPGVLRQHVPSLAVADGLSLKECDELADWRASKFFSASERAALAYADIMTREIVVPDPVFAEVDRHFNARQIVELTVLVGTYNMNARVLQALQLDLETP